METKNLPLLFQQQLNSYYKDILNCEIVHPHYWDGNVPETFFLKKRKGIGAYHDWLGDEVLDYINFDGEEYAIVKTDSKTNTPHIQVKKWLDTVDTSSVATITNANRLVQPTWGTFDEKGILGEITCIASQFNDTGNKLYVFIRAPYTIMGTTTTEIFVVEYSLDVAYNINPTNISLGHTYLIHALSQYSAGGDVVCKFSPGGTSIFAYADSIHKFLQIKLPTPRDLTKLPNTCFTSQLEVVNTMWGIKGMALSHNGDKIFFVNGTKTIGCLSFAYNDITQSNSLSYQFFSSGHEYIGIAINVVGNKIYATSGGYIYQLEGTSNYDITSFSTTNKYVKVDNDEKGAQDICISPDNSYITVLQRDIYIAELAFAHSKMLVQQDYSPDVYHSFKRNIQSVKGRLLYGDGSTTKITGTSESEIHKLTPTVDPQWTANAYAGCYVYIVGGATSAVSTTGVGGGQILQIKSNTSTYLTVNGWDTKPNQSSYAIFDNYGEVLSFIGGDGLYVIHNDDKILRLQGINTTSNKVVDATWNNGRIFALLQNGTVACSAVKTSDGQQALSGGYYAGFFNGSSIIGSTVGALRLIPFNDIVVVFTHTGIYVIKKESFSESNDEGNTVTTDTFPMNLAFDFVGLHSQKAVCTYNTGIYFISDKREFLSLNIEESYYNKYKITTEDLGIDIQQWLDNIEEDDEISLGIDTETIYITWEHKKNSVSGERVHDKSVIFQYDTFYSFRHRRETKLIIKNLRIDTNQTYLGPICYRYGIEGEDFKLDDGGEEYVQHLRRFNGDSDIFSLKTILYHKLYLGANTDIDTEVQYKARLSDGIYEYVVPLKHVMFLQKSTNLSNDGLLGKNILGFSPLGGKAEDIIVGSYLSDVDVLEIPLGLTYSLLEITVQGDFETGGNLLGYLQHDPHLTAYEDVVPYMED